MINGEKLTLRLQKKKEKTEHRTSKETKLEQLSTRQTACLHTNGKNSLKKHRVSSLERGLIGLLVFFLKRWKAL